MFRKKDNRDTIHQTNIKRGITSHFARTLKVLQQRHLQSDADEFIYSDDFSNNLCSALEAVFLHGLKDSVAQKVSTIVGLSTTQDLAVYLNFWSICAKFTHKDVITQLRGLSQINTEIGLCRSWIRLALNDGLMESYLHSMLVDKKTLAYYYHSYSYLRDHEQPGILKNYFTGLMSLSFKLSFNSSVLNAWNNASLQLAGLLDGAHVPGATLSSKDNVANSQTENLRHESGSKTSLENKKQDEPIVADRRTLHSSETSGFQQGDLAQPMFSSMHDVEEIRRIALAHNASGRSSYVPSDGSTSSHVSCPDPSSFSKINKDEMDKRGLESYAEFISPALYPRADADTLPGTIDVDESNVMQDNQVVDGMSATPSDHGTLGENDFERSQTSTVIGEASSLSEDLDSAIPISRPRSRRVEADEEITLSPQSISISLSPSSVIIEEYPNQDNSFATINDTHNSIFAKSSSKEPSSLNQTKKSSSPFGSIATSSNTYDSIQPVHSEQQAKGRTYDEICATLPPIQLDPAEQEAILRKVLGEIDEKADKERAERHKNEALSNSTSSELLGSNTKGEKDTNIINNTLVSVVDSQEHSNDVKGRSSNLDSSGNGEQKNNVYKQGQLSSLPSGIHNTTQQSDLSKLNQIDDDDISNKSVNKTLPHHGRGGSGENKVTLEYDVIGSIAPEKLVEPQTSHVGSKDDVHEDLQHIEDSQGSEHLSTIDENESSSSDATHFQKSGSYGNSLSSMMGWSSEIESSQEDDRKRNKEKTRAESFASMLKSYAGQYQAISTTLDQVLEGLPSEDGDAENTDSNQQSDEVAEERDSDLDEFEVLSSLPTSAQGIQEVDTSRMIYLFRVPREHGLSHQNFTCRGCARPIGIIYGPPRLCEFDGGLYCFECHQNNEIHIPSSIVYNWDFSKKKVCMENYKFLQELDNQPLYDIDELNPKLEAHVPEFKALKALRKQLRYLKSYLFSCSQKMAESLRQKVWPREHLYDTCCTYSVSDLFQVQSGSLQRFIKDLVKFASKHVYECSLCCQKGFICEICQNRRIIYPFEVDTTVRCPQCKSVFHQSCMTENLPCPKCERWGRRSSKGNDLGKEFDSQDHPEDYGISPPYT